jgi:hypothetical protein
MMSEAIKKEILDFIKAKTGAASALVFLSTAEYPCQQEKDGVGCMGHLSQKFQYGIDEAYLPGMLHSLFEDMSGEDHSHDVDEDD